MKFYIYIYFMDIIWKQITEQILLFFTDLNWRYILLFVLVMMGIKDNVEFKWWGDLLEKVKLRLYSTWIAGLVMILVFCLFTYLEDGELTVPYISSILRSFFVVIAFSDIILRKLRNLGKPDKEDNSNNS